MDERLSALILCTAAIFCEACGCHGAVRATTDRSHYQLEQTVNIQLDNGSNASVSLPDDRRRVQLIRRVGDRWVEEVQKTAFEKQFTYEDEIITTPLADRRLRPCRSTRVLVYLPDGLPPGSYRVSFRNVWRTNVFVIGPPPGK